MKKRLRAAALLAALALLLPAAGAGGARAASPEAPSAAQSALRAGSYGRYLAGIAEQPAGEAFTLKASAFTENPGGSASRLTEYKGGRDVLMVADQEDSLTYRLQVPRTGRYRVVFRYYPIKGNERPAELGLEVDGAVPFPGAERFTLGRVFTGETAIQKDAQGNEYAPRQVEHFDWFEEPLKLLDGTADDPAELYLEAGEHTLTLAHPVPAPMFWTRWPFSRRRPRRATRPTGRGGWTTGGRISSKSRPRARRANPTRACGRPPIAPAR